MPSELAIVRQDIASLKTTVTEVRDSSRSNGQTLVELIVPTMERMERLVNKHEEYINKQKGQKAAIIAVATLLGTIGGWVVSLFTGR